MLPLQGVVASVHLNPRGCHWVDVMLPFGTISPSRWHWADVMLPFGTISPSRWHWADDMLPFQGVLCICSSLPKVLPLG